MKRTILICLFLPFTILVHSQEYYVLQVKGTVKKSKTGALVKTKDVIKADEQLTFSSATDAVALVNPKAGRFILKPGKPTKTNELIAYMKDALSQASSRLSTRSGGFNNVLDLKAFFKDPVLLLPELQYKVNGASFPISESAFFFIRYQYNGEAINKQLSINKDSLIIVNRIELFKVDGKPIAGGETSGHQLMYFSGQVELSLCPLVFNLADPETVKTEADVLLDALKSANNTSEKILTELSAYLVENYAKVDDGNLRRWMKMK